MRAIITSVDHSDAPRDCAPTDSVDAARRRWETIKLVAVILFALVLRMWGLEQNGWGAEYYTAAVRSVAINWRNFLYRAFDPAGFISI